MRHKRLWIPLGILVLILVGLGIGFRFWMDNSRPAVPEALESLKSDSEVTVESSPWLTFLPRGSTPRTGLILYPGGWVDPKAYAPLAKAIGKAGYLVVIPPMPLNLAVLHPDAADEIIRTYPGITNWIVGGHSLGGTMAAFYTDQNSDKVSGLLLWASYPANRSDLSDVDIAVTSIYGTSDGLATPDKILASAALLPELTVWVPIEGGNHAQFGWYGPQAGDNPANISQAEQDAQIAAASIALLAQLDQ